MVSQRRRRAYITRSRTTIFERVASFSGPEGTRDRFGLCHSSRSAEAIARFEDATFSLASHRPSTAADLGRALAADEHLVAGHVLKGFSNLTLARAELGPAAKDVLSTAEASLLADGGTADERALVEALRLAVAGRFAAAAVRLDALLDLNPTALLPAKLAHALRFMLGDASGMLASSARILDQWSPSGAGFGFLLGCQAFALEELGTQLSGMKPKPRPSPPFGSRAKPSIERSMSKAFSIAIGTTSIASDGARVLADRRK
ncbi:MAG: hypothetical protein K0R41_2215 [Geminicoccaceae bacterium]|jgi:hypothetical protein|nr:hypothetical protein [Geminicoccaceae bacterium]